jgi:hypothetical protein
MALEIDCHDLTNRVLTYTTPSSPITTFGASTGAGANFSKYFRNLTSASTLKTEPGNTTSPA